ncbi:malonate--CoA ligase [Noviherbaspirillum saxi]|uniref:Malonyl-CoA synthase n=1 Tax=Noviherbaspirillum saxi TaxID=2320863 RepID=A0A3A3FR42_9BURK|nr:malonyl-CoA synthase [Noviherbaspirillum saxi]RJF96209.1 malonyl-CoA synthase [Noviherbaspirillum saxi]
MQNILPSSTDPVAWIDRAVKLHPDRAFILTAAGRTYTYEDMHVLSGRFATALAERGVEAGDRVAAQVDKSPEALMLYLGCLRLGAVFLPLNTAYTVAELKYFIGDAEPQVVVMRPDDRAAIRAIAKQLLVPHMETLGTDGDGSLMALAKSCNPSGFVRFDGDTDALAALLYTSGTTGRSKGAMLTRANLASNAAALVDAWRFTSSDVLLHALPIFHAHGLFIAANTMLACGGSMLFLEKFDADEVMRLLPLATAMMGIPTFYTRLLKHTGLTREATAHMRLFVSGSAPLLADTYREFEARTGHAILERYATTETLVNTSNPYDGPRLPGAVGTALPGTEIRITATENPALLNGPDSVGMIEVRGPNVFKGYWKMLEKTREEFREDNFFITGDLGKIDQRGYVHIVGRDKDLIITGGYNVYPKEVEGELDALQGVVESAVFGLPHKDFGEGVTAVVVMAENAPVDEVGMLKAMEGRLAKYKLPKRVLIVPELPRNTMGKVQKNVLRDLYADLYN